MLNSNVPAPTVADRLPDGRALVRIPGLKSRRASASLLSPLLDKLRDDDGALADQLATVMVDVMLHDPQYGPNLYLRLMDRTDGPVTQRIESKHETVKRVILEVAGPRERSSREVEADDRTRRLDAALGKWERERRGELVEGAPGEQHRPIVEASGSVANEPAQGPPEGGTLQDTPLELSLGPTSPVDMGSPPPVELR